MQINERISTQKRTITTKKTLGHKNLQALTCNIWGDRKTLIKPCDQKTQT